MDTALIRANLRVRSGLDQKNLHQVLKTVFGNLSDFNFMQLLERYGTSERFNALMSWAKLSDRAAAVITLGFGLGVDLEGSPLAALSDEELAEITGLKLRAVRIRLSDQSPPTPSCRQVLTAAHRLIQDLPEPIGNELAELGLPVKLWNSLARGCAPDGTLLGKVRTVEELCALTVRNVCGYHNVAKGSVECIHNALKAIGRSLRPE